MGLGDELLAVGEAETLHRQTGRQVAIGHSLRRLVHSSMELGCPWVVQPGEPTNGAVLLRNVPRRRPYIDYKRTNARRQVLIPSFRPTPGRLFFTDEEEGWASHHDMAGAVVIEPHVKGTFSAENKAWPWHHWHTLVVMLRDDGAHVVQMSKAGKALLRYTAWLPDGGLVRRALCGMSHARVVVTSEGLLHHAAAGMGLPAVVLWGDHHDPRILGYPGQTHIQSPEHGLYCGALVPCEHCTEAMESITPEMVFAAVTSASAQVSRGPT